MWNTFKSLFVREKTNFQARDELQMKTDVAAAKLILPPSGATCTLFKKISFQGVSKRLRIVLHCAALRLLHCKWLWLFRGIRSLLRVVFQEATCAIGSMWNTFKSLFVREKTNFQARDELQMKTDVAAAKLILPPSGATCTLFKKTSFQEENMECAESPKELLDDEQIKFMMSQRVSSKAEEQDIYKSFHQDCSSCLYQVDETMETYKWNDMGYLSSKSQNRISEQDSACSEEPKFEDGVEHLVKGFEDRTSNHIFPDLTDESSDEQTTPGAGNTCAEVPSLSALPSMPDLNKGSSPLQIPNQNKMDSIEDVKSNNTLKDEIEKIKSSSTSPRLLKTTIPFKSDFYDEKNTLIVLNEGKMESIQNVDSRTIHKGEIEKPESSSTLPMLLKSTPTEVKSITRDVWVTTEGNSSGRTEYSLSDSKEIIVNLSNSNKNSMISLVFLSDKNQEESDANSNFKILIIPQGNININLQISLVPETKVAKPKVSTPRILRKPLDLTCKPKLTVDHNKTTPKRKCSVSQNTPSWGNFRTPFTSQKTALNSNCRMLSTTQDTIDSSDWRMPSISQGAITASISQGAETYQTVHGMDLTKTPHTQNLTVKVKEGVSNNTFNNLGNTPATDVGKLMLENFKKQMASSDATSNGKKVEQHPKCSASSLVCENALPGKLSLVPETKAAKPKVSKPRIQRKPLDLTCKPKFTVDHNETTPKRKCSLSQNTPSWGNFRTPFISQKTALNSNCRMPSTTQDTIASSDWRMPSISQGAITASISQGAETYQTVHGMDLTKTPHTQNLTVKVKEGVSNNTFNNLGNTPATDVGKLMLENFKKQMASSDATSNGKKVEQHPKCSASSLVCENALPGKLSLVPETKAAKPKVSKPRIQRKPLDLTCKPKHTVDRNKTTPKRKCSVSQNTPSWGNFRTPFTSQKTALNSNCRMPSTTQDTLASSDWRMPSISQGAITASISQGAENTLPGKLPKDNSTSTDLTILMCEYIEKNLGEASKVKKAKRNSVSSSTSSIQCKNTPSSSEEPCQKKNNQHKIPK